MISAEILLRRLREQGCYLRHDLFTDDAGAAFLLDTTPRNLRRWREISRVIGREHGPPATFTTRWLYEVDALADWWNRGGMRQELPVEAGSMRKKADKGGQR